MKHSRLACTLATLALAHATALPAIASEETPALSSAPATAANTKPVVRQTAPGVYHLGDITIDKNQNTVSWPAVLNMDGSIIEYLIVGENGKTHESLLRTKTPATQIHTAMLLLGSRTETAAHTSNNTAAAPPGNIDSEYLAAAPGLTGDPIIITLAWQVDNTAHKTRAESFFLDREGEAPLTDQQWIYNGSYFHNSHFMAQSSDSIGALITDPAALFNRAGHHGDVEYLVRPDTAPPIDTPVTITLQLTTTKPSSSQQQPQ